MIYRVPSNFAGAGRRVYPGFLQHTGFVAMNPDRHATSHYDYFKDLIKGDDASADAHTKFYDEYNAVLDMDAGYYLDTIKTVFQEFKLVNGTWEVKGVDGKIEKVRPEDITTTAHFTVEGELDDISGSGQTEAAHGLCYNIPKALQKHLEVKGAGHYGIFAGRRWRDVVYPAVKAFILENNDAPAEKIPAQEAIKSIALEKTPVVAVVVEPTPEAVPKTVPKAVLKPAQKPVRKPVAQPAPQPVVRAARAVASSAPAKPAARKTVRAK